MTDDTVELDREKYEEFMSILDGVLDGIYRNGYEEPVEKMDELRDEMVEHDGPSDEAIIERLEELKEQFDHTSPEYADVSMTIAYLSDKEYYGVNE